MKKLNGTQTGRWSGSQPQFEVIRHPTPESKRIREAVIKNLPNLNLDLSAIEQRIYQEFKR